MKRFIILFTILAFASDLFASDDLKLWYDKPASDWNAALPIGNGRIGAMVFGRPSVERIQLNEETVWAGSPNNNPNPAALEALPIVRKLIFEGRNLEAMNMATEKIMSNTNYGMPYQSMGDMYLSFAGHENYTDYYRDLDISNAIATVSYRVNGVKYKREYLTSLAEQVLMIRLCLVSIDCEFIGIDVDEDSLSRAATRARGWSRSSRFMQLDVNRQPEQVPSGDLCLLFNVSSYIDDFGGLLRTLRIHRPGGAVAIRQYDGAALRFGPMPPESRLSIDSALHSAVRPLSHFRHYDMDRVVEEIQAAGFASTTVEFELYARVAPFSAEDFAYIDAMIGWTREHVSGIATPLLDSWWRAALKDGAAAYVYEVDLVALLS